MSKGPLKYIGVILTECTKERWEPDSVWRSRKYKPTSKGPLTRVKCNQRNAHTSAILPVFSKSRETISLQNPALLLVLLLFNLLPIFWTFLKAARRKVSLSSAITLPFFEAHGRAKLHQTALKLIPKSLDYTQIVFVPEPCVTNLWFWEVLGQS